MANRVGQLLLLLLIAGAFGGLGANRPPVAEMAVAEGYSGFPISFSLQALDPDGDELRLSIVELPTRGRVSGDIPHLVYVSEPGFVGTDQLAFSVEDPFGGYDMAVVRIHVREPTLVVRWIIPRSGVLADGGASGEADVLGDVVRVLQKALVDRGAGVWNVAGKLMGSYSQGAPVPVVLATDGSLDVRWVAVTRLGGVGAELDAIPYEISTGEGRWVVLLDTSDLQPGVYLVTVGTGPAAYSLPVELKTSSL